MKTIKISGIQTEHDLEYVMDLIDKHHCKYVQSLECGNVIEISGTRLQLKALKDEFINVEKQD